MTKPRISSEMEFHVSRQARDRYQFDDSLFALSGNVIIANFHAARVFAQKMNARRDLVRYPEQAVRAGQINAMGLIDEILHLVVALYHAQRNPNTIQEALDWSYGMLGKDVVDATLHRFCQDYPPLKVYRREVSVDEYLSGDTEGIPNRLVALEEMLLLWLANSNPAFAPFHELFDDSNLEKETAYSKMLPLLQAFFDTQPTFGPEDLNLIEMLHSPAIAEPHSMSGQLEYIRRRWGYLLGRHLYRLLSSLDLIREEEKIFFLGAGPARVVDFRDLELELERFSQDKDWMPRLVLIAKNAYVWLDQLSKKYQRHLFRLDHIPDEELDSLARWGFTGLWLIGLWERSPASQRIKQLRGNPEAVSSAYSLFAYQIANDLGGDEAYQNLRDRAWLKGIRLASDMVPNHMGIDSDWIIEHPDWFISLDSSPFPSYTYNGPDLSWDERVGIFIEDHYFDNSDAAVVFKRVDRWAGDSKYIYHGNDGTSMPWNDTAQLNYLKPEVREAVIQTILHVARKFPVIRFDAAMTLAKKHYQRLWFPEPGSGGDIPSRAGFGLTKEQFDAAMPIEFWREVVDRVTQELPDTLLLAEAFWLMEGYFVRTLGMHRVYNSAFMNMLRDEKNAEYRLVIKNTLEFDPEILKRYVNFMNNPDERTAVDQFGKGDKYFGISGMMATMPGLPMFGHGQIQGFTEKYGMEYRRAYWDEQPDSYLVDRHEREIFPLLRRRYLFADVSQFLLYDFYTSEGYVNEDVFAYSNSAGEERSLVIYHNKFASTRGWIRNSAAYSVKSPTGERMLVQRNLGEGMGLENDSNIFTIFRDHLNGLEYIRNNHELFERGLFVELDAYQCRIYLDFRQAPDDEYHQYAQLAAYLAGRGVPSIDEALKEIFLQPVHQPFRELVNAGMLRWLITKRLSQEGLEQADPSAALDEAQWKMKHLLEEIKKIAQGSGDEEALALETRGILQAALRLPVFSKLPALPHTPQLEAAKKYLLRKSADQEPLDSGSSLVWGTLLGWVFIHGLGKILEDRGYQEISRSWIDEWMLGKILAGALVDLGLDDGSAWRCVGLVRSLTRHAGWAQEVVTDQQTAYQILKGWLSDSEIQRFCSVNRYQGMLWFNQESFEELLWWLFAIAVIQITAGGQSPGAKNDEEERMASEIVEVFQAISAMLAAEARSGFQVEKLLEAAQD